MDAETIRALSHRLLEAERCRKPIDLLSAEYPSLGADDAYAIASETTRMRAEPVVGFKLGYTSAAMREQMGIAEPNFGYLTRNQFIDTETGMIDSATLIHPLVEPEIAFVTGRDVDQGSQNRASILSAIDAAFAAIEIVDTRYKEYKFTQVDNIADNSSGARFILGAPHSRNCLTDLRLAGVLLWSNAKMIDQGIGANALGDPVNALAWLANSLASRGERLPAGSIVLTGGLTRAHPLALGQTVISEIAGLGSARVHFGK